MSDNTVTYTIVPASGYEVVCLDGPDVKKLSSVTRLVIAFCIPLEANGCAGVVPAPSPFWASRAITCYGIELMPAAAASTKMVLSGNQLTSLLSKFIEKGAPP